MSFVSPTRRHLLQTATVLGVGLAAGALLLEDGAPARAADGAYRLSDADWRRKLTPAQYDVLRGEGTEMAFSSPLDEFWQAGTYHCAGCGQAAYSSRTKFESHTGWPSFWQPLPHAVAERSDSTLGMERTEVHCSRCQGHLGHVFDDGPKPTGLRYCMNGVALSFQPGTPA